MPLTPKKQAFCEYYIQTQNATEAAKKAGYSEKTAYSQGSRLLKGADVAEYIKARMDEQSAALIATSDEVLRFLTSTMRGEVKDQFDLDPSLADRLKAAEDLMKIHQAAEARKEAAGMTDDVVIINDLGGAGDGTGNPPV